MTFRALLYYDSRILVLNKPPRLVSQGTKFPNDTNIGNLLRAVQEKYSLEHDLYPVHRLDKVHLLQYDVLSILTRLKNTSGCLVFARTPSMARDLSNQFQTGSVKKSYLAVVRAGAKTFPTTSGDIVVPLSFNDGRTAVDTHGKMSATKWEVLDSSVSTVPGFLRDRYIYMHRLRIRYRCCNFSC